MSEQLQCKHCGRPMPQEEVLGGRCPRCMLEMGLAAGNTDAGLDGTSEGSGTSHDAEASLAQGTRVGRYRIIRLIGEGGMGAVYEAEQEEPQRTVALKVIKPGLATPEVLRRFQQEAQALARLQHPGIAQIYEAGTADTGFGPQPYFAMELVRGATLKDFIKKGDVNTRQRLEIVAKVCDAVQHAHQRGLIHRDLKPTNIVVDHTGQPKILDFGIARVTGSDSHATSQTDVGQLIGTLAYMSPEQVKADPLEIDTRTDVYALGVILYELLAGRLPYNISKHLTEVVQAIREEDPTRLSVVNRSYRGDIETIVAKALEKDKARRYGSASEFAADITHYLRDEPIVARPPSASYQLKKFATRHRSLVASLAAAFVVLIGGVSVSTWEAVRATKAEATALDERNKSRIERDRARDAERRAEVEANNAREAQRQAQQDRDKAVALQKRADVEAATSRAVIDFLGTDLLGMADPVMQYQSSANGQVIPADPNLTVKQALDRAAARVTGRFDKQPLVEAALRETMAGTYSGLGAFDQAREQRELAVEIRRREQGDRHPQTIESRLALASTLYTQRNYAKAATIFRAVWEDAKFSLGANDATTTTAADYVRSAYLDAGNFQAYEDFLENELISLQRKTMGESSPLLQSSIRNLLGFYETPEAREPFGRTLQPRHEKAETYLQKLIEEERRTLGADHYVTLANINLLVRLYITHDKTKDAEATLRLISPDALVAKIKNGGRRGTTDHSTALETMSLLVQVYTKEGKDSLADTLLDKVMQAVRNPRQTSGDNLEAALETMISAATTLLERGRDREAEETIAKAVEAYREAAPKPELSTGRAQSFLVSAAQTYLKQRKYRQAQKLFRQVMEIVQETEGAGTMAIAAAGEVPLIETYSRNGTFDGYEESERILTQIVDAQKTALYENHNITLTSMRSLSQAYWDHGKEEDAQGRRAQALEKYGKAETLINQLLTIYQRSAPANGAANPGLSNNLVRIAQLHGSQGRYAESEKAFSDFLAAPRRAAAAAPGAGGPNADVTMARCSIGWTRLQRGMYAEAEPILREVVEVFKNGAVSAESTERYSCESVLGASLAGQKRYADAEPFLLSGYEGLKNSQTMGSNISRFSRQDAGAWIVRLYEEWGRPEKAAEWRARLIAAPGGQTLTPR